MGLFLPCYHSKLSSNRRFRSSSANFGRYQPRKKEEREEEEGEEKGELGDTMLLSQSRSVARRLLVEASREISSPRTGFSRRRRFFSPCEEKKCLP
ncbi:hypothetical protein BHE74_00052182, partial [Ensete ventricosum]